jgi:glycosyltransferase involved in cell wall biosynthesis
VKSLVLYAPNVNTGGGLVLLQGLMRARVDVRPQTLFLDARASDRLAVPAGANVHWVSASVSDRLRAERALARIAKQGDTALCFHGLPPVLPTSARVVVFLQNRNLLGINPLSEFPLRIAMRIGMERAIGRMFRHRVARYVVQTASMRRELERWHGGRPDVRVCPALDEELLAATGSRPAEGGREPLRDFLYVADGVAHKNHARLLEAWRLLAAAGLYPTLALTLGARDAALAATFEAARRDQGLAIENLGTLSRDGIFDAYRSSRALLFPSTSESFGLPLIEASRCGVPVVASELDFVRDVCRPAQTFDPTSPVSIARAVRRFLGAEDPAPEFATMADFYRAVID